MSLRSDPRLGETKQNFINGVEHFSTVVIHVKWPYTQRSDSERVSGRFSVADVITKRRVLRRTEMSRKCFDFLARASQEVKPNTHRFRFLYPLDIINMCKRWSSETNRIVRCPLLLYREEFSVEDQRL